MSNCFAIFFSFSGLSLMVYGPPVKLTVVWHTAYKPEHIINEKALKNIVHTNNNQYAILVNSCMCVFKY